MATRAPSSASRRAMPRPIRRAAPVTRMTWPARLLDRGFAMDFDFLRFDAFPRVLVVPAGEVRPAPEYRGCGTEDAGHGADGPGVPILRGHARQRHRDQHDAPGGRFRSEERRVGKECRSRGAP